MECIRRVNSIIQTLLRADRLYLQRQGSSERLDWISSFSRRIIRDYGNLCLLNDLAAYLVEQKADGWLRWSCRGCPKGKGEAWRVQRAPAFDQMHYKRCNHTRRLGSNQRCVWQARHGERLNFRFELQGIRAGSAFWIDWGDYIQSWKEVSTLKEAEEA